MRDLIFGPFSFGLVANVIFCFFSEPNMKIKLEFWNVSSTKPDEKCLLHICPTKEKLYKGTKYYPRNLVDFR